MSERMPSSEVMKTLMLEKQVLFEKISYDEEMDKQSPDQQIDKVAKDQSKSEYDYHIMRRLQALKIMKTDEKISEEEMDRRSREEKMLLLNEDYRSSWDRELDEARMMLLIEGKIILPNEQISDEILNLSPHHPLIKLNKP